MTIELTHDLLKSLLRLIVSAQIEAAIAQRLALGVPSLPPNVIEKARREVIQDYAAVVQSIEDRPSDAVLELLLKCGSTLQ